MKLRLSEIRRKGEQYGISLVTAIECGEGEVPLEAANAVGNFQKWQAAGYAADMRYLQRSAEQYFCTGRFFGGGKDTDPKQTSAKLCQQAPIIILSFFIPYLSKPCNVGVEGRTQSSGGAPLARGRVARYAWGLDYHLVLPQLLTRLVGELGVDVDRAQLQAFSDAVSLHERWFAAHGGLGFVGKNSLLITYRSGSFGFLAELLLRSSVEFDLPPQTHHRLALVKGVNAGDGCGGCSRCQVECPTSAIVGDGIVDSRRCISYLTIEKRGAFSDWESEAIGDWVFGCDACQDVCPFNACLLAMNDAPSVASSLFLSDVGPLIDLDLCEVLAIRDDQAFRRRFKGRALLRAKREGLLRNAAAVAKNTLALDTIPVLIECLRADHSAIVRSEVVRTLRVFATIAAGVDKIRIANALSLVPTAEGKHNEE